MAFRDLPIKRKLVGVILLTCLAVLGLTSLALMTYELHDYKQTTRRNLLTIAELIASNSTAVLISDDQKLAAEILSGLRAEQEIASAALFDKGGQLYASYAAATETDGFPAAPGPDGIVFGPHDVTVFHPVVEGSRRVGT